MRILAHMSTMLSSWMSWHCEVVKENGRNNVMMGILKGMRMRCTPWIVDCVTLTKVTRNLHWLGYTVLHSSNHYREAWWAGELAFAMLQTLVTL